LRRSNGRGHNLQKLPNPGEYFELEAQKLLEKAENPNRVELKKERTKSKLSFLGYARCVAQIRIYENQKGRAFLPPEGDSWEKGS